MTQPKMLKTISSSMFMAAMVYAPTAYADNNSLAADEIPQDTDITEALIELQRKDIDVGKSAPTTELSTKEANKALKERGQKKSAQSYDLESLKADPQFFTRYLNSALAAQDMATVKELLPHYKNLQVKDPMLIKFADALVYRSEGKNKEAIAIYKGMLAENPDFHPVRLNMAQALYADKQYLASYDQLQKLKGANIPEPVMVRVDRLMQNINEKEQWSFNTSISYISDDNLNDAPEKSIQSQLGNSVEPEAGKGLQISASANKRINLDKNFYAEVGANANLKGYRDKSEYNDYLVTASAGIGYDDAKNDVSVSPFVTRRFYAEEPYSIRTGVNLSASRWVKPKLKLSATGIVSNEKFDEEKDKNRETDGLFVGLNALYLKDANEYFYGGVGTYRNDVPKSNVISYDRNSVNLGWGREWNKGVSTLLSGSYAEKKYDDISNDFPKGSPYYNFLGAKYGESRKDKTKSLDLQIWKRDLTLLGLTPRLVFDYETTSSNFKYYDEREDKSATVMLTKTF